MTMQIKGYPFELIVISGNKKSAILSDQVKSIDWVVRKATHQGNISPQELSEVPVKIMALLE